jgi:hypothetical protein
MGNWVRLIDGVVASFDGGCIMEWELGKTGALYSCGDASFDGG